MCLVLLFGVITLFKCRIKDVRPIAILMMGGFMLEASDLVCRFLDINTSNYINYAISQLLFLICITNVYNLYFFKLSNLITRGIHLMAILFFCLNVFSTGIVKEYSGYSYVLVCCILCGFAIAYFSNVISTGKANKHEIRFNVISLFFFSVEAIVAITYNFLLTNYLDWVAPIWMFRMVLLIVFYITLIQFTWSLGKNKR